MTGLEPRGSFDPQPRTTPSDSRPLHVEAWRSAYRGQVPDEYLDALTVQGRLDLWRTLLADTTASTVTLVLVEATYRSASPTARRTGLSLRVI